MRPQASRNGYGFSSASPHLRRYAVLRNGLPLDPFTPTVTIATVLNKKTTTGISRMRGMRRMRGMHGIREIRGIRGGIRGICGSHGILGIRGTWRIRNNKKRGTKENAVAFSEEAVRT